MTTRYGNVMDPPRLILSARFSNAVTPHHSSQESIHLPWRNLRQLTHVWRSLDIHTLLTITGDMSVKRRMLQFHQPARLTTSRGPQVQKQEWKVHSVVTFRERMSVNDRVRRLNFQRANEDDKKAFFSSADLAVRLPALAGGSSIEEGARPRLASAIYFDQRICHFSKFRLQATMRPRAAPYLNDELVAGDASWCGRWVRRISLLRDGLRCVVN